MSVEDDNFPGGGGGGGVPNYFILVFMFWFVRENIIPGNFGLLG